LEHLPDASSRTILHLSHSVNTCGHPDFGKSFTEPVFTAFWLIRTTDNCDTPSFFAT
ncbi:239_t:CDS:1, partial [Cetraspora pellucida]